MADYYRREVTTRRVEFVVPMTHSDGINWTEVMKAVWACHAELREAGRIDVGQDAPDDLILMVPGDEDIVVRYVVEEAVSSDG